MALTKERRNEIARRWCIWWLSEKPLQPIEKTKFKILQNTSATETQAKDIAVYLTQMMIKRTVNHSCDTVSMPVYHDGLRRSIEESDWAGNFFWEFVIKENISNYFPLGGMSKMLIRKRTGLPYDDEAEEFTKMLVNEIVKKIFA